MRNFLVLALLCSPCLADDVTPVGLQEWYKANGRVPVIGSEFRNGNIGLIPYRYNPQGYTNYCETRVLQVLSDDSALLSVDIFSFAQLRGSRVLVPESVAEATFMMKGGSTRNLADRDNIQFGGWWKVDGTESYESAAGKRTVRVLRRFRNDETDAIDADLLAKATEKRDAAAKAEADARAAVDKAAADELAMKQAGERKEKERQDARARLEADRIAADTKERQRTWTSADGRHTVKAEFLSFGGGFLRIKRLDNGKVVVITEDMISAADMAWLKSRLK